MQAQQSRPTLGELPEPELIARCGDDASMWAQAFCEIAAKHGHDLDEGWMIGWFANAIETSHDVRKMRMDPETRVIPPKSLKE